MAFSASWLVPPTCGVCHSAPKICSWRPSTCSASSNSVEMSGASLSGPLAFPKPRNARTLHLPTRLDCEISCLLVASAHVRDFVGSRQIFARRCQTFVHRCQSRYLAVRTGSNALYSLQPRSSDLLLCAMFVAARTVRMVAPQPSGRGHSILRRFGPVQDLLLCAKHLFIGAMVTEGLLWNRSEPDRQPAEQGATLPVRRRRC